MKKIFLINLLLITFLIGYTQIIDQLVVKIEKAGINITLNNGIVLRDSLFIVIPPASIGFTEYSDNDTVAYSFNLDVFQSSNQVRYYVNHNRYCPVLSRTYSYRTAKNQTISINQLFILIKAYIIEKLSEFQVEGSDFSDITNEF